MAVLLTPAAHRAGTPPCAASGPRLQRQSGTSSSTALQAAAGAVAAAAAGSACQQQARQRRRRQYGGQRCAGGRQHSSYQEHGHMMSLTTILLHAAGRPGARCRHAGLPQAVWCAPPAFHANLVTHAAACLPACLPAAAASDADYESDVDGQTLEQRLTMVCNMVRTTADGLVVMPGEPWGAGSRRGSQQRAERFTIYHMHGASHYHLTPGLLSMDVCCGRCRWPLQSCWSLTTAQPSTWGSYSGGWMLSGGSTEGRCSAWAEQIRWQALVALRGQPEYL